MNKKNFNVFIYALYLHIVKIWLPSLNVFYKGIVKYKIDLDTTNISLLPFYIDEMTFNNFRDILIDFPYANKHVYILDSKGELIYYSLFTVDKELELQEENIQLLLKERDGCIASLRNHMLISCIKYNSFFYKSMFYMHISDKDKLKSFLNNKIL